MNAYVWREEESAEGRVCPNQSIPLLSLSPLPTPHAGNHTGALAIYQGRYKRFAKNPPPTRQTALAFEVRCFLRCFWLT